MALMKKVVLLEFIEEFEEFQSFVKDKQLDISDFLIIALEYKLQTHLKKLGIDFKNTLPYFGNDSYKRILLKFDDIRTYVGENFNFADDNGVRNAYLAEVQHYLELMFNYIAKVLEILQSIYKENGSIELYTCKKKYISGSIFIFNDRFLGLLVEKFAKKNNIGFYLFGDTEEHEETNFQGTQEKKSIIYSFSLNVLKAYFKVFNKTSIIIPTLSYGFKGLINEIKIRNPNVSFITLNNDKKLKLYERYGGLILGLFSGIFFVDISRVQNRVSSIEQDSVTDKITKLFNTESGDVFTYYGIDFRAVIKHKVSIFARHLGEMIAWSHKLKYLTRKFNIEMLISPFGRGLWYIAAELLPKIGKPSLFISHGTHPVPINQYHEISIFNMCRGFMLGDYSHVALGTPVQEAHLQYFKDKYEWIRNKEIKTVPLIFADLTEIDKLKNKTSLGFLPHERVIVHAVSLKWRGTERYYFLETMDEYLSGLADIVSAVNKIDNARLIIRLHPGFDLSNEELQFFLPESNRYIISKSGQFKDVLSVSDMLISYSSTVIDEALINKIPVLLYDKWDRYNHFQTEVYNNGKQTDIFPVCYVNNKDKLGDAINFMLNKIKNTKKEDMDISKYKYMEDYRDNFFNFIDESLKTKGGVR